MLAFALRRTLQSFPTVAAVAMVVFILFSVIPGSIATSMSDDGRGAIGEGGAFGRGCPGRVGERKGGDHRVTRAGDIRNCIRADDRRGTHACEPGAAVLASDSSDRAEGAASRHSVSAKIRMDPPAVRTYSTLPAEIQL